MPTEDTDAAMFDGALCRAARVLMGLSQEELRLAGDCSRKLLNDFENGMSRPKPSKVAAIRAALEANGAVFVRLNDMLLVGGRPGETGNRSARGRSFLPDASTSEEGNPEPS